MDPGVQPSSTIDDPDPVWLPPPVARLGTPLPSEPPPLPATPRLLPAVAPPADSRRLTWLVAIFVAACAAVSYSEWGTAELGPRSAANATSVAAEAAGAEPAQDPSGPWPDPLVSLYETRADAARPIKLKYSIIDPRRAAARVKPAKPKPVGNVAEVRTPAPQPLPRWPSRPATMPQPLPRWPSRPATMPPSMPTAVDPAPAPRLVAAAPPARPTPAPVPAPTDTRRPVEELRPPPPAPAVAARVDPLPGEEERIRTTLARFRTAYAQLDASAAREVWPSVDMRALERAFDGLKSQELRFDRCSFTVDGSRARAECTGRTVYVPRIGNQSPRTTPREWTFELKKAGDERWTIASARSS